MVNHFLSELRRRGVIQALTAYVVGAWLVIQVFDVIAPVFALPAWLVSLIGVVGVVGFPVAAYIAWFFDFSGGTLTRVPAGGARDQDTPLTIWHWAGLLLIALAASGAGFFIFEQVSDRLRKEQEGLKTAEVDASIAVLPFADLSPEHNQAYLADGLAEEITSLLGRIPELETAASSATFRMARAGMDPVAIGRRLGVATVLTGSVVNSGDRLRVRVELANVEDGGVLWRDNFSRTLTDVFAVEEEVARSIANLLQDRYVEAGEISRVSRTASSDAYVFYLRGKALLRERTAEGVKEARKLFEQSVGLDPEFAPGHIGLADTLLRLARGGENFGTLDPEIAGKAARESIERALVLDGDLPEAYANLGRAAALRLDHETALEHYDRAVALNPSLVDAHVWRSLALDTLQDHDAAMRALERAAELDPTAPAILHNLGFNYSNRGDFERARTLFEELITLEPKNPLGYRGLADAAFRNGKLALSLEQWDRARQLSPETPLYQSSYRGVLFGLRMLEEFKPLALAAGDEENVLLLEGQYAEIHQRMDEALALAPEDPWLHFEAAWYRYLAGDDEAGNRLILAADTMFSDEDRFAMPMCSPGIELVKAHREAGSSETASVYLEKCRSKLARARDTVMVDNALDHLAARIAVLDGDQIAAVREMQQAIDHGWLEWWTWLDPIMRSTEQTEALQSLFEYVDAELERQRVLARRMLAAKSG
jgi:TolB-like protein/Tfp pilus assembly protein PilF